VVFAHLSECVLCIHENANMAEERQRRGRRGSNFTDVFSVAEKAQISIDLSENWELAVVSLVSASRESFLDSPV